MKILVIGAGVIGSNLAHYLSRSNDVTVLVRSDRYERIVKDGIVIKHKFKRKTIDHLRVIKELKEDDIYDAIFVCFRFSQIDSFIPSLLKNRSKNIIFVGNNMRVDLFSNLKDKNVLFAFFMAAGERRYEYISSICLKKITIGRIDGNNIDDEFIKSIFKKTKIKVDIQNKMDDYLKSHACAILPLVFATYRVNGNLKLLKRDKLFSIKLIDAMIEGYDVIRSLGYEILPNGEYETITKKKKMCAFLYRFMFSNFIGKLCISSHAMNAMDEFTSLDEEFVKLKEKSEIETKNYDELREYLLKIKDKQLK